MSETILEMKHATRHADALKSFSRKLLRQQEIPELTLMDPLTALVRACLSYDTTESRADDAMKTIHTEFVDLNELRVATELEVIEMIGPRYPDIEARVSQFITCLNAIFAREHSLTLDRVRTLPKREIRSFLRELPGIHPFVEAYTMLFGFGGHAFPVDQTILRTLTDEGIIEQGTSLLEAQKFLEQQLKDDEVYRFFYALRHRKKR
ncbi:MAG: hypothetical protein NZ561_03250 [Phycisphaerae bacterium]|nr:hypothetical protein [Phycisphaerae bacterium]MDW8261034.1 hypothetical protein [Phycisphaerales bacterium]